MNRLNEFKGGLVSLSKYKEEKRIMFYVVCDNLYVLRNTLCNLITYKIERRTYNILHSPG